MGLPAKETGYLLPYLLVLDNIQQPRPWTVSLRILMETPEPPRPVATRERSGCLTCRNRYHPAIQTSAQEQRRVLMHHQEEALRQELPRLPRLPPT